MVPSVAYGLCYVIAELRLTHKAIVSRSIALQFDLFFFFVT